MDGNRTFVGRTTGFGQDDVSLDGKRNDNAVESRWLYRGLSMVSVHGSHCEWPPASITGSRLTGPSEWDDDDEILLYDHDIETNRDQNVLAFAGGTKGMTRFSGWPSCHRPRKRRRPDESSVRGRLRFLRRNPRRAFVTRRPR